MYNYNHLSISYICVALWHFPLMLAHSLHLSHSLSISLSVFIQFYSCDFG